MLVWEGVAAITETIDDSGCVRSALVRRYESARAGADVLKMRHKLRSSDGVKVVVMWASHAADVLGNCVHGAVVDTNVSRFSGALGVIAVVRVWELVGNAE